MVQENRAPHNLIMESRKKLSLSGVTDIDSFNEQSIVAITGMGVLIIKGAGLHISKLNTDSGDVNIEGTIDSLTYTEQSSKKSGSIIKNLFK